MYIDFNTFFENKGRYLLYSVREIIVLELIYNYLKEFKHKNSDITFTLNDLYKYQEVKGESKFSRQKLRRVLDMLIRESGVVLSIKRTKIGDPIIYSLNLAISSI